jgi:hypothetical protein
VTTPIQRERADMIANLQPVLRPGLWVFVSVSGQNLPAHIEPLATFREEEGLSVVLDQQAARAAGLSVGEPHRQITLNVYSALDGVGLTAAVAGALADAGIACNMIAAFHHDHVFVPAGDADRAMRVLRALQSSAQA